MSNYSSIDTTPDDRLWALLAYLFSPIVPIFLLLMEEKRNRPFLRAHNMQALIIGALNIVILIFLWWLIFPLCLNLFFFIALLYWGIKAYQGEYVNIPVVTDFVKKQGWA